MVTKQEIESIVKSESTDPFTVLGIHKESSGISIRTFQPDAEAIQILDRSTGDSLCTMEKIHPDGFFYSELKDKELSLAYELSIQKKDGSTSCIVDPYSFLPIISEYNRFLFNEGNNQALYEDLGSHVRTINGVTGTHFAVWAPNAKRVSVIGHFNNWNGKFHQMRVLGSSGIWEIFIPHLVEGTLYKYEIKKQNQDHLILKSDPYGYYHEPFPYFGTAVVNLDKFSWTDDEWLEKRKNQDLMKRPMSIYEVHLGSWRKSGPNEEGDYLSYRDLAEQLADYVLEMGFTHIELLPVQEHPYVPSWGYQVTGFYAVNHRFGTPEDFQYFVNYLHEKGIGVILDWVSGHFPKDSHGLAHFDGSHLYEHQDPREGLHQDWGTLVFNYGRHEVRNFLTANALFWCDKFHIDGLRVDAVASMLYRNYSRNDGGWIPNKHGGVENLEAIQFLQSFNYLIHTKYPGVLTIAEESTAWPNVTKPTYSNGLGFTYKWNMGWMHDILLYFSKNPIYRSHHHDQLTFGLWYAFSENFVLVLSHDEVVHGKRSILEKMPGDTWNKFANLRALFAFMYGHPGKKLLFMGAEFGMHNEWYEKRSIDWHTLQSCGCANFHRGVQKLIQSLNALYRNEPCLWTNDSNNKGFSWIDFSDYKKSICSFIRIGDSADEFLIFVCNFTPILYPKYKIGVPRHGFYKEILNTDSKDFGGSGQGNPDGMNAMHIRWQNQPCCIELNLAPQSVTVLKLAR